VNASPAVRTPQLILRGDTAPTYGPPTRTEAAIETSIRRGYGGTVTNEEMAGSAPSSPVEGTTTEADQ
jgi:hypothetical protein